MAAVALPGVGNLLITLGVTFAYAMAARMAAQASPRRSIIEELTTAIQSVYPYNFPTKQRQLADELALALASPQVLADVPEIEPYAVSASAEVVDTLVRDSWMPRLPDPTFSFSSVEALELWLAQVTALYQGGAMTREDYDVRYNHYRGEHDRLTAPAVVVAPPVVVPEPPGGAADGAARGGVSARATTGGVDLSGLVGAIGGLTSALPAALGAAMSLAADKTNAVRKDHHRNRLACLENTALSIGDRLRGALLGVAGGLGILSITRFIPGVRPAVQELIDPLVKLSLPTAQVTPDNVDTLAIEMLVERTAFGAAAHLVAHQAEANANVKTMNTGMIAAFLADLAGYSRLAAAWLGQVEQRAIQPAMARKVNRIALASIPDIGTLSTMYAKKEITREKANETLAEWGYDKFWQETFDEAMFLDPRLGETVRAAQFYNLALAPETATPSRAALAWLTHRTHWLAEVDTTLDQVLPDWYWWYKFMKGGYEMTDVKVLVQVAKRAVVRREQTLFFNAILRLYRDGYIVLSRANDLVLEGWGVGTAGTAFLDPIKARMRAMDLQVEYNRKAMAVSTIGRMQAKGFIGDDEAVRLMEGQGMAKDVAVARMVQAKLGLLPTRRLEQPDSDDVERDQLFMEE